MSLSRFRRVAFGSAVLGLAVVLAPASAQAQVGDISDVNYPGWIPADQVDPQIDMVPVYDAILQRWRYDFTLGNGPLAEQDILSFWLRFALPQQSAPTLSRPSGWWRAFHPDDAGIPGVTFHGERPGVANPPPPSPDQIPPNGSLSGFDIESEYPPGYARVYVRGYAGFLEAADLGDNDYTTPHDTTNAQRRWTLAPTRYTVVVTGGNRRPATDGFLGFMNLSEKSSVLTDPAPIALEFSLNGEVVDQATLQVKLNGVDVTDQFHPGASDGADLVAVFFLGTSPLQEGKNVLLTSVDGQVPGTSRTGTDSDRIVFLVDPTLANSGFGSSFALENLPYSEPGVALE